MFARVLLTASLVLLTACQLGVHDNLCPAADYNYLQDTDFALEAGVKRSPHWTTSQHAGEMSFDKSIADGELTIRKFGTQPWYIFRQRLRTKDLAGKKIVVSAELKLDLQAPAVSHSFKVGGGLSVVARSERGKIVLRSIFNHDPHLGTHGWQEVQVIVQLPPDTSVIEVGFLHQADGTLQARKPALHRIEDKSDACAVTPESG